MRPGVPDASLRGLLVAATVAALGSWGGVAHAAPFFTMTGGTSFINSGISFDWVGPQFNGGDVLIWEGGVLGLSEPGIVTLEYIGKEALFADNIFRWNNEVIFTTGPGGEANLIKGQTAALPFPPAALATSVVPDIVPAGPLPFSFFISFFSKSVPNDGNLDIGYWPIPPSTASSPIDFGDVVYVLLDDENTADADHDDMIVRLTVAPVPEPATLAGAATGLLGGWWLVRRRARVTHGPRTLTG
jgi:hypothetical protein